MTLSRILLIVLVIVVIIALVFGCAIAGGNGDKEEEKGTKDLKESIMIGYVLTLHRRDL